ncbi:MAG: GTP-binding protein [Burkholderiales bacterium]|nr:MAG: GTP-binding protein [Burkholderiales bacterium]
MPAIPLVILTGFLGSGKSTLLARLLRSPEFADTAVIVNEFGEVGIDHALLARGDEDNIVLLDSGCICCSLTSSLEDTLETLYYRRERGEIPRFERVMVETTGLADPGPIATALSGGMFVARQFGLGAIVVTVDAVHGTTQLEAHEEARRQVAMADRIVLTKVDIASAAACAQAHAAIEALNPFAPVQQARMGETELGTLLVDHARRLASDQHAHGAHAHTHDYASVAVRVDAPVDWPRYAAWVARMQREAGDRLLRVKGFLRFDDGQVRLVQGVQLLFTPPAVAARPVPPELLGTVVLIGHRIDAHTLRELCATLAPAP